MNTFTYGATTVTTEHNPLHVPRQYDEEKKFDSGYLSDNSAYGYDIGAPIFYTEEVTYPAETLPVVEALIDFFEMTTFGGLNTFTWVDRGVNHTARFLQLAYVNVTRTLYQVKVKLEVQS